MKLVAAVMSGISVSASAPAPHGRRYCSGASQALLCAGMFLCCPPGNVALARVAPKPATDFTAALNASMYDVLDFSNQQDFEDASRGFIAGLEPPRIITNDAPQLNDVGFYAWNLDAYQFLNESPTAPPQRRPV